MSNTHNVGDIVYSIHRGLLGILIKIDTYHVHHPYCIEYTNNEVIYYNKASMESLKKDLEWEITK